MAITDQRLYQFHVTNIRSIEIALNNSALAARSAISEDNKPAIRSFVSLYALLLGLWAETRLNKLLYENNGLSVTERNLVVSESQQLDKWLRVIEVAFRKHYNILTASLNESNLPFTANARYIGLKGILEEDLKNIMEIRNKLAHGQWVYPLNNEGTNVEQRKYRQLNDENLPSLQYKKELITSLADIIHDLVVSRCTLERDCDRNYKKTTSTRTNLRKRSYEKYAAQLIAKRERGIQSLYKNSIYN
jgi:hypothetical protein